MVAQPAGCTCRAACRVASFWPCCLAWYGFGRVHVQQFYDPWQCILAFANRALSRCNFRRAASSVTMHLRSCRAASSLCIITVHCRAASLPWRIITMHLHHIIMVHHHTVSSPQCIVAMHLRHCVLSRCSSLRCTVAVHCRLHLGGASWRLHGHIMLHGRSCRLLCVHFCHAESWQSSRCILVVHHRACLPACRVTFRCIVALASHCVCI